MENQRSQNRDIGDEPDTYARPSEVHVPRQSEGPGAMQQALEKMRNGARNMALHARKSRARKLADQPWQLDLLYPDLSRQSGAGAVLVIQALIEQETASDRPPRFGAFVPMVNLRAAEIVARATRRAEARQAREAA